jgi:hypothetical protein
MLFSHTRTFQMQNPTFYILPILLIVVVIFLRIKRGLRFQKYIKLVPILRILVCSLTLVMIFSFGIMYHPSTVFPDTIGVVLGFVLAFVAVRKPEFEMRKDGLYYFTIIWIEVGILVIFFARLAYVFYDKYGALGNLPAEQVASQLRYEKDPVTGSIISVFCTYYIGYFTYIASKARKLLKPGNEQEQPE